MRLISPADAGMHRGVPLCPLHVAQGTVIVPKVRDTFIPFYKETKTALYPERAANYIEWIRASQRAREADDLDRRANKLDKAEEIMTWVTYAPLLRMDTESRSDVVSTIIDAQVEGVGRPEFEMLLQPPESYLEVLKTITVEHPVRYIREQAKRRIQIGKPLEGLWLKA